MAPINRAIRIASTLTGVYYAYMVEYRAELLFWVLSGSLPLILMGVWTEAAAGGQFGLSALEFARYFIAVFFVRQFSVVWVIWEFEREVVAYLKRVAVKQTIRVDILATICTRMVNYLTINQIKPTKTQMDNIKEFVKIDFIPNDIRLTMAQDLVSSKNRYLKPIMADREIGKMLLARM